jgi:hypothetical protein
VPRSTAATSSPAQQAEAFREANKLLEVDLGEASERTLPPFRELQSDEASILLVGSTPHEVARDCPVDQLDDAVVAKQEVVRDIADRRTSRFVMTPNGEEELMLRRR